MKTVLTFLSRWGYWIFFFLLCGYQLGTQMLDMARYQSVPYSQAVQVLNEAQVEKVAIYPSDLELCTAEPKCYRARHGKDMASLQALVAKSGAEVTYKVSRLWGTLGFIGPLLLIMLGAVIQLVASAREKMKEAGAGLVKSQHEEIVGSAGEFVAKTGTTFADVAGNAGPKQDLLEIVEALRNAEHFKRLGAKLPRGTLLVGPPGNGKTLLARAVAGEVGVPFIRLAGSDLNGIYMSVGAERVRGVFARAREAAKETGFCILFIDELDAVGATRGESYSSAGRDSNNTINALLVEMDGFDADSGVIVLAATNHASKLDPALVRAGRFDRKVNVPAPFQKDREEILALHGKRVRLAKDLDWSAIAQRTPGMAGADLANVIDEAARLAARQQDEFVTYEHICDAIEHLVIGHKVRGQRLSAADRRAVAIHESGHAVALAYAHQANRIAIVSIIATVNGALGFNFVLPEDEADAFLQTQEELLETICHLLGGRAAEKVLVGSITNGASDDIRRATEIARRMVERLGMSDDLPNLWMPSENSAWSEATRHQVDMAIQKIINECYARTVKIMEDNRATLEAMTSYLLEHEELEGPVLQHHLEAVRVTMETSRVA